MTKSEYFNFLKERDYVNLARLIQVGIETIRKDIPDYAKDIDGRDIVNKFIL